MDKADRSGLVNLIYIYIYMCVCVCVCVSVSCRVCVCVCVSERVTHLGMGQAISKQQANLRRDQMHQFRRRDAMPSWLKRSKWLILTTCFKVLRNCNYHNFGHYPSSCLIFEKWCFGDLVLSPYFGGTYSSGYNRQQLISFSGHQEQHCHLVCVLLAS
jgi:hypothetical protein